MRFNKTTEYAFRVFAFMAMNSAKVYSADEILEHLKIPQRYLRRLLTDLSKSGLMESIQGNKGGYRLRKEADKITLFDILNVTESKKEKNVCFFGFHDCQFKETKCPMHENWITIIEEIDQLLKTTTITDLTNQETQDYIIGNIQFLNKK